MEKKTFKLFRKVAPDKKKQANGKIEFEVDALEVCVLQCMALCFKMQTDKYKNQWKRK